MHGRRRFSSLRCSGRLSDAAGQGRNSSGSLADVGGDAPSLVASEEVRRRTTVWLPLEIDVSERLPVGVADDEAGVGRFDGPRVAVRGLWLAQQLPQLGDVGGDAPGLVID